MATLNVSYTTVHMTCPNFPGVDFWYVRPLEAGSVCRIVEQTSTYKTLVCDLKKEGDA